jgi:arylsulfatase A-like enzyme
MKRLLSLCVLIVCCLIASVIHAAEKTNVIYILADDLGYGDLSCYGQQKFETPNIDRLAAEGMKFTAHYSGNTVCTPSRAVLMTGQHSGHCHVRGNLGGETGAPLDPEMTVLPELFKSAGYATGAFGKWGLGQTHLAGNANPLTHGFDEYYGWKSQSIAHTYYPTTVVHNGKEVPLESGTYIHQPILEHAREFIASNSKANKPFFCYIPTAIPHAAMHAPQELHEKWRKKFPQFDHKIGKYKADGEPCPDVVNPIAGFAAMMEHLDHEVGKTLKLVQTLGIDDNTLIMFASDNGAHKEGGHDPAFWNSTGNLRGYKRDMHEGGIRTPMLARWPGVIKPGGTTAHISGFQDLLPTMAELIGQPIPEQNDGISFLPTLQGETNAQKDHDYLYFEFCKGAKQQIFSQAVRVGDWKAYREKGKAMQLFDLSKDPYEQNNIAKGHPQVIAKMNAIIKEAHVDLPTQK